jgi:hypothetical protein
VADGLNEAEALPAKRETGPSPNRQAQAPLYRHRFGLAYVVLAMALGGAVAGLVLLVGGGKDQSAAWSTWRPEESGVRKLNEIAKRVERAYALPNGNKLVLVYSTPLVVQDQGQTALVRAIAVSTGLVGETGDDASFYDASTAWAFSLCGSATNPACGLPGEPSRSRYDLLRREALELALYTLKYNPDVESVVAYMPPAFETAQGEDNAVASTAVFLRREELSGALDVPLARTLTPTTNALRPGQMSKRDLDAVLKYTDRRIYRYSFQPLQDGSPLLTLQPIS